MGLSLDQLKKEKRVLEDNIMKLLKDFEKKDSDLFVNYIDVYRRAKKGKNKSKEIDRITPPPEREGEIYEVKISLRFDI